MCGNYYDSVENAVPRLGVLLISISEERGGEEDQRPSAEIINVLPIFRSWQASCRLLEYSEWPIRWWIG